MKYTLDELRVKTETKMEVCLSEMCLLMPNSQNLGELFGSVVPLSHLLYYSSKQQGIEKEIKWPPFQGKDQTTQL